MTSLRGLIYALYNHWDILEIPIPPSRLFPVFEQLLLTVIDRNHSGKSFEEHEDILYQFRIRSAANSFSGAGICSGLTREQELGLFAILRAGIEAIKSATLKLSDGTIPTCSSRPANWPNFWQISQHLDQDRHTILGNSKRARPAFFG